METLGAPPDILTFDGEPGPVGRNPLTPGTRPLQLLPLPGMEFPIRYEKSRMRGFQSESLEQLCDAATKMRGATSWLRGATVECRGASAEVRYAAVLLSLRFTGPAPPLDSRYQAATLGAQLVRSLLGVTTQTRYSVQGCMSYEMVFRFWAERIRARLEAWRELPEEARPAAPVYIREERDQATRTAEGASRPPSAYVSPGGLDPGGLGGGVQRFLSESVGDFPSYFASRMQARLPEILEYTQERKTHKIAAYYRAEAASEAAGAAAPAGVVLGDVPFPPGMEVVLDPGLGLGSGIIIPADLRQAPPPVQLAPEHTTHVPAQRYQEICIRDLEIGRLRRHQARQSSAVSRLQAELLLVRAVGGGSPAPRLIHF
ncbi:hypothetical protein JCGZ_08260 [Jatropha curcas]|uniref:Aminotransferase-like plant mobile domain-containing protein n=1 Tax=Jatropha curcas TaxID=180498 RepID=A0A067L0E9_JATCU|nr:hypothetical protein JCGZ_08260 [Jatropha curcas]